ncbi:hypothetical protein phiST2_0118 [Vibrio phage phi-ST2]|nr:hypothetical protein phiST2_0118 [Vibrio phage phi-ST2]
MMKIRFIELEDGYGQKTYRIQARTWYWPFWSTVTKPNGYGGDAPVERNSPEELVEFLQQEERKERRKARKFRKVVGEYDG